MAAVTASDPAPATTNATRGLPSAVIRRRSGSRRLAPPGTATLKAHHQRHPRGPRSAPGRRSVPATLSTPLPTPPSAAPTIATVASARRPSPGTRRPSEPAPGPSGRATEAGRTGHRSRRRPPPRPPRRQQCAVSRRRWRAANVRTNTTSTGIEIVKNRMPDAWTSMTARSVGRSRAWASAARTRPAPKHGSARVPADRGR